jgi:predicted dithiol-disulfide oxidoreductase (DUF899 family)
MPTTATLDQPSVVSRATWLAAREELLRQEKAFTRQRDELSRQRRALPWVRLDQDYVFDGPRGRVALGELFAGRSQLIVYHFMFGPGWEEGCKSCSYIGDHFDGLVPHLNAKDIAFAVVSRAPLAELTPFQARLGWKFNWVSSAASDFNRDFHVSFTPEEVAQGPVYYNYTTQGFPIEEAPGLSVFAKNVDGEIFHTYSTYSRGLDLLIGAYNFIDLTPKGRNEDPDATMSWVRYHDRY